MIPGWGKDLILGVLSASTQTREGYRPVLGTGAFQRSWTEALGLGDGETVKNGQGRPSPSKWEGKVGRSWTCDMLFPLASSS